MATPAKPKRDYFPFSFFNAGIMGINARNLDYIARYNRRRNYPLVDDKVLTKELSIKAGIPSPELYGVIEFQNQVHQFAELVGERKRFVVKPSKGSGGGGIVVIHDVVQAGYRKSSGVIMPRSDMRYHLFNILSGMYSLGGQNDRALIEYAVEFDPIFDDIAYRGVPDIRLLVYRGIPVMAMLRLPTRASDGKANLHMGGIGVGVRMSDGMTLQGIQFGALTYVHPETSNRLDGRHIPHWRDILEYASRFYDITGMGYVGVDMVLDRDKGPMLLEVNARPGIAIQVANRCGLLTRLNKAETVVDTLESTPERVDFAMTELDIY